MLLVQKEKDLHGVQQGSKTFFIRCSYRMYLKKGSISLDAIWQHEASSWTSQWDPTQTLRFIPMLHFQGTAP